MLRQCLNCSERRKGNTYGLSDCDAETVAVGSGQSTATLSIANQTLGTFTIFNAYHIKDMLFLSLSI